MKRGALRSAAPTSKLCIPDGFLFTPSGVFDRVRQFDISKLRMLLSSVFSDEIKDFDFRIASAHAGFLAGNDCFGGAQ